MFGIDDPDIEINPEDIGQGYYPRKGGYQKRKHFSEWCQACREEKGCAAQQMMKKHK